MIEISVSPKHGSYLNLPVDNLELEEIGVLYLAWRIATDQHLDQFRRSGRPYIEHPLAVATLAHELGLDVPSVAAALLHDVLEEGNITCEELLIQFGPMYGPKIVRILISMSKEFKDEDSTVTWLRIFFGTERDFEVIIIKLIDRLHNLVCPYAGNLDREMKLLEETKKIMPRVTEVCRNFIPNDFQPLFDDLISSISDIRISRISELFQR